MAASMTGDVDVLGQMRTTSRSGTTSGSSPSSSVSSSLMTTPAPLPNSASDPRHRAGPARRSRGVAGAAPGRACTSTARLGSAGTRASLLAAGAGRVIGIDRDRAALAGRASSVCARRADASRVRARRLPAPRAASWRRAGLSAVDGCSSISACRRCSSTTPRVGSVFDTPGRSTCGWTRAGATSLGERLGEVDEAALADVIWRFGEERHSRRIARAIVAARDRGELADTLALAAAVRRAAGGRGWQRIDPATRTFQALRIWVERRTRGTRSISRGGRWRVGAGRAAGDDRVSLA